MSLSGQLTTALDVMTGLKSTFNLSAPLKKQVKLGR
jgi:hypothetical protein